MTISHHLLTLQKFNFFCWVLFRILDLFDVWFFFSWIVSFFVLLEVLFTGFFLVFLIFHLLFFFVCAFWKIRIVIANHLSMSNVSENYISMNFLHIWNTFQLNHDQIILQYKHLFNLNSSFELKSHYLFNLKPFSCVSGNDKNSHPLIGLKNILVAWTTLGFFDLAPITIPINGAATITAGLRNLSQVFRFPLRYFFNLLYNTIAFEAILFLIEFMLFLAINFIFRKHVMHFKNIFFAFQIKPSWNWHWWTIRCSLFSFFLQNLFLWSISW